MPLPSTISGWRNVPARPVRACPRAARPPRGRALSIVPRRSARSDGRPRRTARSPRAAAASAESAIRCTAPSASRSSRSTDSARCAPRFVPATACTSSRMSVSTVRSISRACDVEDQKERLRRRDEDVRRPADHRLPLLLWRVARAHGDRERRADARERCPEIALDVVVQRLQRRHVEQSQALARARVEAVDAVEERRERLPGAGRRLDEHVPPARDRRPTERLSRGRCVEHALEPRSRLVAEQVERVHETETTVAASVEQVFARSRGTIAA